MHTVGAVENACFKHVGERLETATRWRVTKGILDAGHRTDRRTATLIVADQRYPFDALARLVVGADDA